MGPVFDDATLQADVAKELNRLGVFFVKEYQERVPPVGSKSKFPGDGPPSGRLKNAIRRRVPYVSGKKEIVTTIYLNRQEVRKYWLVHEDGMTIKPKVKNFMVFYYQGRRWKAKSVTIKPKHYIRDSIAALEQEIATNTDKRIRQYIQFSVRLR